MANPEDDTEQETYDWWEPVRNLLKLVNIIACHALGVFAIVGVAQCLEAVINFISSEPLKWTMNGVSVSLSDIVHYGDLVVFAIFLCVALFDLVKWAWRR